MHAMIIAPMMSAKSTETIGVTTIRVFSRFCSEYMPARRWRLDSLLPSSAFWFLMSATVPPLLLSCHGERDLLDGRVLTGVRAHDLALEEDRDAVESFSTSSKSAEIEKDRAPSVALGDDLVVDELRGSNVQAARGVDRHEELPGWESSSRARMTFCWLPPDSERAVWLTDVQRMSFSSRRRSA